jgi:hypothetical protein
MPPGTEKPRTPARAGAAPCDFFFYGTLRDPDVRAVVFGRKVEAVPATLDNHEAVPVEFEHGRFPILQMQRGKSATGVLCRGVTLMEAARLGFYEHEGRDYGVKRLPVRLDGAEAAATLPAWVFVQFATLRRGMGRWDLAEWQRFAKREFLNAVTRAMRKVEAKDLEPFVDLWRGRASIA